MIYSERNIINNQAMLYYQKNLNDKYKDSGAQDDTIFDNENDSNITEIEELKQELEEAQSKQGFIGKLWNGFKNLTGLGLSTNDIDEKIKEYENGELTFEEAEQSIESFNQKQNSMVDMITSIASGLAVAGSAVLTGGTSLLASAVIGGVVKAGLKTADRGTNNIENDEINIKQIGKDMMTGAVDGFITTLTAGIGSSAKTVAGGSIKEAVKSGAIQGAKQGVISGGVMGATNYSAEAIFEEEVNFEADKFLKTALQGAVVGGVMGGVMGGATNGIKQNTINKLDNQKTLKALDSCQLSDEIKAKIKDLKQYNQKEKELIQKTYDAIQANIKRKPNEPIVMFEEGSIKRMFENGEITEDGIKAMMDIGGRSTISDLDYNFLCKQKGLNLTSIDTDYIASERYYSAQNGSLSIDSESFKSQAQRIIQEQEKILNSTPSEGKVVIVSGHPASGKSTITKHMGFGNYYSLDPDQYKPFFIEYADGLGTDVVHKASGEIRDRLTTEAVSQNKNIILEITGTSAKVAKKIKAFQQAGYQVEVVHINRTTAECAEGLVSRATQTGRVVPPEILLSDSAMEDYTQIPRIIKEMFPDIKISVFNNSGTLDDFINSRHVL